MSEQINKKKIIYVGEDEKYWLQLSKKIREVNKKDTLRFHSISLKNQQNYQSAFLEIIKFKPAIIYLDFSRDYKLALKCSNLIKNEQSLKKTSLAGLVKDEGDVEECLFSGAETVHVKGPEFYDVVNHPFYLKWPDQASKELTFTRALANIDTELICDLRVGYVTDSFLRAEGDIKLQPGDLYHLETHIPKDVYTKKTFLLESLKDYNLYYNYEYAYDFFYQFDEINKTQETASIQKWIEDNRYPCHAKKIKIMLYNQDLSFISESEKHLDDYPYTIRTQLDLKYGGDVLFKVRPDILALKINSEEDCIQVKSIVEKIKETKRFSPFIICFKDHERLTHDDLRKILKYPYSLISNKDMSISLLISLADKMHSAQTQKEVVSKKDEDEVQKFKQSNPERYSIIPPFNFEKNVLYASRKSSLSKANFNFSIKILEMSESECIISSNRELIERKSYRIKSPLEFSITITGLQSHGDHQMIYHGLIHSIGESRKSKLRKFINQLFFSDLNEKRKQEMLEQEKIKKEYIDLKKSQDEEN